MIILMKSFQKVNFYEYLDFSENYCYMQLFEN
jgi:hypothetical protein